MSVFDQLAADLEKYFGLGPLFIEAELETEETNAARGAPMSLQALAALSMTPLSGQGTQLSSPEPTKPPRLAKTGIGRQGAPMAAQKPIAGTQSASVSAAPVSPQVSVNAVLGASSTPAGGVFVSTLAVYSAWEEERTTGRKGGGGGARSEPSPSLAIAAARSPAIASSPAAKAAAARAAVAAGAQAAVFKVISTASRQSSAKALMEYLGRREDEEGKKHDIAVHTEDGRTLETRAQRAAYLEEFTAQFREPFQTTNFVEVTMTVASDTGREVLHEALNQAFGSKPFLYARDGATVKVFAYTEAKASKLAKELGEIDYENGRGGALQHADASLSEKMAHAGVSAEARMTAAVSTERQAQYFLQKFMRNNRGLVDHAGDDVKVAKRADKSAARVFESWKPQMQTREVRNAFHLLFSAKAGTNPEAVMASAKAVLDAHAPGHKFVLAHHAETKHVHVHAMVSAVSASGDRLAFRKADLLTWREAFAEKMRENGVEMVATRRMDMGATRPYTMRHAGAVERNKDDPRYRISSKTAARVANKRAAVMEPKTLVANGDAIARGWKQSAVVLQGAGAAQTAVDTANRFAATVLSFDRSATNTLSSGKVADETSKTRAPTTPDSDAFMQRKDMQAIMKMIGDTAMAKTPLEMRERMHEINSSLDKMRQTLPEQTQVKFDEFREKLNDQMYDRLAQVRHPSQKPAGAQSGEERQMRERDVRTKTEPQQEASRSAESGREAQAKAAATNKAKAKAAEQQNRSTQRSQDNEYER